MSRGHRTHIKFVTGQLLVSSTARTLRLAGTGAGAGIERTAVRRVANVKIVVEGTILSVGEFWSRGEA